MDQLTIDRSELADTAQADKLAALIIGQLSTQLDRLLPLPIEEVARACGILEIRTLETAGFEGGLIQDEFKEHGYILTKAGAGSQRSRFTIAHELGHFVNLRHVAPPGQDRLLCNKEDLRAAGPTRNSRHGMEAQANEFASCLLMPARSISPLPFMRGAPKINRILALQELCNVSKEAAARRYADLHGDDFAVVFSRDGSLAYAIRGGEFPWLEIKSGQPLFRETMSKVFKGTAGSISEQEESDPYWWLNDRDAKKWNLWEEVLIQENGFRMTLLLGERAEDD
jgi:Zn-dependent peptidase ImmA (M78 family)